MRRPWLVLAAMALPLAALSMDVNGIGTVLPAIRSGLGTTFGQSNWVVTAATLAFAVALLPAGRWCARHGRRVALLAGVVALGVASLLAAAAPDLGVLVAARVLQGVAGALCFTTSLAEVASAFDEEHRPAAVGAFGAISGIGAAAGPLVGGAVVDWWTWRGFFLVNAVLCLASVPALLVLLPPDRQDPSDRSEGQDRSEGTAWPLARLRLALASGALVLGVVALGAAATRGFGSPSVLAGGTAAVVLLAAAVVGGRVLGGRVLGGRVVGGNRSRAGAAGRPTLLSPTLLSPAVRSAPLLRPGVVVAASSTWAFGVTLVYATVYLEQEARLGPFVAGACFAAYCAAFAVAGPAVGPLVRRWGLLPSLAASMAFGTVGLVALALLGATSPLAVVVLVLVVAGAGQGLCFDCSTDAGLDGVPPSAAGESSAVVQVARLAGFSVGVAVSAAVAGGSIDRPGDVAGAVAAVFGVAAGVSAVGTVATVVAGARRGPGRQGRLGTMTA